MTKPKMLAIAGVAALAIAGCGDDESNTALSYDDYTKRVNQLCKSVNDDLKAEAKGLTGEAGKDADIIAAIIPKVEDANEDFGGLTPPEELQAAADDFAAGNERQLEVDREAADAAKAGDQQAYEAALEKLQKLDVEGDKNAAALGAEACIGE